MDHKISNTGGFFLADKPSGISSARVVSEVKKKFGFKKVGHAGTLDPFATGLLIVLVDKFTKKFDFFQTLEKEYEATVMLGKTTDTYDVEGKVISGFKGKIEIEKEKLLTALKSFEGKILQKPPSFSALKIKGTPSYKLAREGKVVELSPRKVFIKKIELTKLALPKIYLKITCSSGTYIRSLANDLGEKLGFGAYLFELKRTRIGKFDLKNATSLEELSLNDLRTNLT